MGFVVRETQPTPNPNAMKYVLDRVVSTEPVSMRDGADVSGASAKKPGLVRLAELLLAVPGAQAVLLVGDFVTINKSSEARWADINRKVKQILAKFELSE